MYELVGIYLIDSMTSQYLRLSYVKDVILSFPRDIHNLPTQCHNSTEVKAPMRKSYPIPTGIEKCGALKCSDLIY